tara:strand:+ start:65 stop:535 length:471 start_codon:yes stop_codon:yes gene_type:complete
MTNQRFNFVNAFCPSVLMEAFAIDQSLRLLIDWTCIEYVNRSDSEDYAPEQRQGVKVKFGGLIDGRLRGTDVWEEHPYHYDLLVTIPPEFEDIDEVDCLLTVVTTDYFEETKDLTGQIAQYPLDLKRFKHLYPFLISDAPEKALKILKPYRVKEFF